MKKIFFAAVAITALTALSSPSLADEVSVCTGGSGGVYEYVGQKMQQQLRGAVDIEVVNTLGSWDNLQKLSSGECDVAITQSDALYLWEKEEGNLEYFTIGELYTEFVHLLCNRKSSVTEFAELTQSTKVFSGGRGSGADVTIRGLVQADAEFGGKDYVKVPLVNEPNPEVALVKIKGRAAECLVYVGARGNKFMGVQAEKLADDLVLVPVEDKDFNDVTMKDDNGIEVSVWSQTEMPYSTYNNIMPSGFTGRQDVPTMGVTAMMIVSDDLVTENPDAYAKIGFAIGDVMNIVRADKKVELID